MNYATIRLSQKNNYKDYFDLKFKLLENTFTAKWINRVLEAKHYQYPISEPWAMYNINNDMSSEFVIKNLNQLINKVDAVEPLFGFNIDSLKDQEKLNKIHAIFEKHHGQLDDWKKNTLFNDKPDSFRKHLSEINQFIHACESIGDTPKIRVVWFDLPKTHVFTDSDYELFTINKKFGSLYHLYCDVGKNIEDLATDNDQHHHDVVPNIHYSADCVAYFRDDDALTESKKCAEYIKRNHAYLLKKGYKKGDKRLTIGRIELARLETKLTQQQVMSKLKLYDRIQDFYLS